MASATWSRKHLCRGVRSNPRKNRLETCGGSSTTRKIYRFHHNLAQCNSRTVPVIPTRVDLYDFMEGFSAPQHGIHFIGTCEMRDARLWARHLGKDRDKHAWSAPCPTLSSPPARACLVQQEMGPHHKLMDMSLNNKSPGAGCWM